MPTWNSRGLRGSTLEDLINMSNDKYRTSHLALVQKIPTPINPINIDQSTRHIWPEKYGWLYWCCSGNSCMFWCKRMCNRYISNSEHPWTSDWIHAWIWETGRYLLHNYIFFFKRWVLLCTIFWYNQFLGKKWIWWSEKLHI